MHMFIYVHCQHISTHACKTCVTLSMIQIETIQDTHDIPSFSWVLMYTSINKIKQENLLIPGTSYQLLANPSTRNTSWPRKPMGFCISPKNINQQPWLQSTLVVDILKKTMAMGHTLYRSTTLPKFQSRKHHPFFPLLPRKKYVKRKALQKNSSPPPLHLFMCFA